MSGIAPDFIRSYVDRILRLKEEARGINEDIREVYAEAKGNGFDKTALGRLVTYIDKRQTDSAKVEEADAIFDLYLCAYDGKAGTDRATHAHAREAQPAHSPNRTSEPLPSKSEDEGFSPPASGGDDEAGDNSTSFERPTETTPLIQQTRVGESRGGEMLGARSLGANAEGERPPQRQESKAHDGGEGGNVSAANGHDVTAGETAASAPLGVSSQTKPEARMPRASSPVNTGKGGRIPVPGAENNRFVRERQFGNPPADVDLTIPPNLRRDGKKAQPATECKDISQAV